MQTKKKSDIQYTVSCGSIWIDSIWSVSWRRSWTNGRCNPSGRTDLAFTGSCTRCFFYLG